jgi:hypothetical protein
LIHRLERYSPPGYDVRTEISYFSGIFFVILFLIFIFYQRFQEAFELLFGYEDGIKVLLPNVLMPTFKSLDEISFSEFLFVSLFGFRLIRYRYRYFNVETKSGYVMLRLPRRFEYHKRCWVIPVAWMTLSYLLFFLIKVLSFIYYKNMVPLSAWPPGQSMNLWSVIL